MLIVTGFVLGAGKWWAPGPPPVRRRSRIRTALLLFLAAQVVSTIASIDPWLSLRGTIFRQQGLLTLVAGLLVFVAIGRGIETRLQWERLVTALILASIPVCLYAIVQRLGLDPLLWEKGDQQRVASTMGNPIFLGAYAGMIFFPTLGRALGSLVSDADREGSSDWLAASYGTILLLQLATLWFTQSRGPLLAWAAASMIFGACLYRQAFLSRDVRVRLLEIVLLLVLGLCGGVLLTLTVGLRGSEDEPLFVARTFAAWTGVGAVAGIALRLVTGPRSRLRWPIPVFTAAMVLLFTSAVGLRIEASHDPTLDAIEGGLVRGTWERAARRVTHSTSARERMLYWTGYLEAFTSPRPFAYVPATLDQEPLLDPLHPLRFLVGTGPETGGALFHQHFPEELKRRHAPGATVDRAHNDAWDRLTATGLLGMATYLWLLGQLFGAALQASGYAMTRRERRILLLELCGGFVAGAALAAVAAGPHFLGVGGQIGVFLGVCIHVVRGRLRAAPARDMGLMGCALLAGLLCHVVEGTVGFPVTATSFQFWAFTGLLVAAAGHRGWSRRPLRPTNATRDSAVLGVLAGLAVGGLAYALLGQDPVLRVPMGGEEPVAGRSATMRLLALPHGVVASDGGPSSGLLLIYAGLLLLPWLWSNVHLGWEQQRNASAPAFRATLGWLALTSSGVIALAWLSIAWHQLQLQVIDVSDSSLATLCDQALEQSRMERGRALLFYAWGAVSLGLLAALLRKRRIDSFRGRTRWVFALLAAPLALFLVWQISLRPVQADIVDRAGLRWRRMPPNENSIVSVALLREAVEMAPEVPSFWFDLVEATATAATAAESGGTPAVDLDWEHFREIPTHSLCSLSREDLLALAHAAMARVREVQPSNPLLAVNLSRLYAREAALSEDPTARRRARERSQAWQAVARGSPEARSTSQSP